MKTFLSTCCPGTSSDSDSSPPRAARRHHGTPRGPPDHAHFNPAFNFGATRYSDTEPGPAPTMQRGDGAPEDAQVSPRTVPSRQGEGGTVGEASFDEEIVQSTSANAVGADTAAADAVGGLHESPTSVYSRPTNEADPTSTPSVSAVAEEMGVEQASETRKRQGEEEHVAQEAISMSMARTGAVTGLNAKE